MNATVELLLNLEQVPEKGISPPKQEMSFELEARIKAAKAAGLLTLANREREQWCESVAPLIHVEREKLVTGVLGLSPLAPAEYALWALFLSTAYRIDDRYHSRWTSDRMVEEGLKELPEGSHVVSGHGAPLYRWERRESADRRWTDYAFKDGMPLHIRDLIPRIIKVFDFLEIRTPESRVGDPALFGWVRETPFLIARWGGADANLVTLAEIRDVIVPACAAAYRARNPVGMFALSSNRRRVSEAYRVLEDTVTKHPHLKKVLEAIAFERMRLHWRRRCSE